MKNASIGIGFILIISTCFFAFCDFGSNAWHSFVRDNYLPTRTGIVNNCFNYKGIG